MKRCGIKTKGIYFIPFLGAAAVTDAEFPSYKSEVFIALAGPVIGMIPAIIFGILYYTTHVDFFGGAALWMFTVTAFNLLPVMPLDGGRVFRCVALSIHSWGGIAVYAGGIVILCLLSKYIGLVLVLFCAIIGGLEVIGEAIASKMKRKRQIKHIRDFAELAVECPTVIRNEEIRDKLLEQENPKQYLEDTLFEQYEKEKSIKHPMGPGLIAASLIGFAGTAAVSIGLTFVFHALPGAELALHLLQK
jgi:hypothetical protein